MLKNRIIPTLLLKDVGLVKGKAFDHSRRVGSLLPAIKIYNHREVDELILLDVSATPAGRPLDFDAISQVTSRCLMPLTVGGGISDVDQIKLLLQLGVDKITINSAAYRDQSLITSAAEKFGSQCIVSSIDVKKIGSDYRCFSSCGTRAEAYDVVTWAKICEKAGAGEIMITAIDKDGTMSGYDLALLSKVTENVNIPVIASGGAGNAADMYEAISLAKVSAVAAASIFHFTEQTPLSVKHYLLQQGVQVRKVFLS